MRATTVLASGVVGDLNGTLVDAFGEVPAIAGANGVSLGVWNVQHLGAAILEDAGVRLAIPVPASSANSQFMADVTAGGGGFLVVWDDSRADVLQPMARRFSAAGLVQGSTLSLSAAGSGKGTRATAGPGQYLVAWSETSPAVPVIRVSLVSTQGTVLNTMTVGGSPAVPQEVPALAYGPGEYLVAWDEETSTNDVYAARVRADGGVSAPFVIANNFLVHEHEPAVAGTATQWLVAWSDVNAIRFTRAAPGGTLLDSPAGTVLGVVAARFDPSIATNGTDFLVAWFDNYRIAAARILANGTVLDTSLILLDNQVMPGEAPHAAWDGRRYVVSWQKLDGQVIAPTIPASGPVSLGTSVSLMAAAPRHLRPRMAFVADNGLLAAHTEDRLAPLASARLATRAINYQPAGGVCTSGFDCLTGICTASVCRLSDGGVAPDAGPDGGADGGGDGGGAADGGDGGSGSDAGELADGGDGGSGGGADAGADAGPPRTFEVGCGCHAASTPAWFGLLAIAAFARRRRFTR
ncbi:MAG: MYXO-CTERM sorting domain-containing protein [Myxococcaceae bacterium]